MNGRNVWVQRPGAPVPWRIGRMLYNAQAAVQPRVVMKSGEKENGVKREAGNPEG